ncbi:TfoX/Sxy family protein [Methylobacterium nonmethylotrophicum]|uniref:TfoX family protein n=1 Tax=Methylobacterium nonmethylotrophicum TaxID=1141884 RepID=A0A4Z0NMY1_9HYPH|nr:TfoX/Sxy family protein [Methylobacterium nonmethylotrophicum]TGD98006.1 TfoX family protein [Methylobacterium nonmethylotrophicum]
MTGHGDRAFLEEMLAPLGGVALRRMFGGLGLFRDGLMFGLVARDVLYFKAAPDETAAFAAEGGAPFSYATRDGRTTTIASYWRAPERLNDDPEEFLLWARRACAAAEGADRVKPAGRRKARVV